MVTKLWEGVEVTNGLGFSPDRQLLYHCDSTTHAVWAYAVRADRTVHDRQVFARLPEGMPDGMTVDAEGGVWIAVVGGRGEIVRFTKDGTLAQRIKVPAKTVTSVAFGGPDMRDLYVVTANNDQRELKGTVFRARSEIPGLPVPKAECTSSAKFPYQLQNLARYSWPFGPRGPIAANCWRGRSCAQTIRRPRRCAQGSSLLVKSWRWARE